MNSGRPCNSSDAQQVLPIDHDVDARVEVLLFLGIIFWCWLLFASFHQGGASDSPNTLALYWDGATLQTGLNKNIPGRSDEKKQVVPAAVTPFLFLPIPVNSADVELLATISGIGPELAAQIIQTRNTKGHFATPQDLLAVPGIGPSRMNQFAPQFSFTVTP
jgi:competence ComEA-like helix-hairpin-helix protein